jgi:ABC-2 type transport system ATP-binding protein
VADLSTVLLQRVRAGCTVVFSSHQLDLVQDLCEAILMIDHGRAVLSGGVGDLRASSGTRQLRLTMPGGRAWLAAFPEVTVVSDQADELRLSLPRTLDPLVVLDAARGAAPVSDFGLDLPTLSQLFMLAAGHQGGVGISRDEALEVRS